MFRARRVAVPAERVDVYRRILRGKEEREHYERYAWAAKRVHGDVLDVACGTGYGTAMLARRARVSGVDRDEQSVETAQSRVAGAFLAAVVPPIPFPDGAFDFVVSFETVEHIAEDVAFLR
jgi:2-polyprenyl-3-methyl-5-hydroxy-6-metoxy-1,4-benzoquinol methylase